MKGWVWTLRLCGVWGLLLGGGCAHPRPAPQPRVRVPSVATTVAATPGTVTLAWDANPPAQQVTHYRLHYGTASGTYTVTVDAGTALQQTVTGLTPGVGYYFAADAQNAEGISALSAEVVLAGQPPPDPRCVFPTGDRAVSIFPTALQYTGSGGPGSRARLDFQAGSPNSPIVSASVVSGAQVLGVITGSDLSALAGLWWTIPTPSGDYPISASATNAYGCSDTKLTAYTVHVP